MESGIRHTLRALGYSLEGLTAAIKHELAFRQELAFAVVLGPAALLIPTDWLHRLYLIGALFLVLIVELLNSAIEATIDHISEERHPLSKRAKDLGSAAVLLSLLHLGVAWLVTLYLWWKNA